MRRFGLALFLGALFTHVGCGSSGSNSGAANDGGPSTAAQFIQDYCQTLSGCCAGTGKTFDSARCVSSFQAEASGHELDTAKATECLDGLHAAKANGTLCDWRIDIRAACLLVFTGNKQPGDTCVGTIPTECAPSPEGDVTCFQSAAEHICQVRITGKAGDSPCLTTQEGSYGYGGPWNGADPSRGYVCRTVDNLYCDPTSKACVKAPAVGAACDGTLGGHSCGAGAYCDRTTNTCVARPAAGGDCSQPGVLCAIGTYCDSTTTKCAAELADGAPCTSQQMCANGCLQNTCGGNNTAFLSVFCK